MNYIYFAKSCTRLLFLACNLIFLGRAYLNFAIIELGYYSCTTIL